MERWKVEWQSIEARIDGLQSVASMVLAASGIHHNGLSHEAMCKIALVPALVEAIRSLKDFNDAHGTQLPPTASRFLTHGLERVRGILAGGATSWQGAVNATAALTGLRVEVSASLLDVEAVGRKRTERAFEHLSRSIVVDDVYRQRWEDAFEEGETACERLGAVHLLLHGIWAFKSQASGERTDLVLQDKLAITRTIEVAEALVLTEWKLARTRGEVLPKAREGKRQAMIYTGGSLAAIELASVHYIVVVTEQRETMPEDELDGSTLCRFINVAVSPESPSEAARKRATC